MNDSILQEDIKLIAGSEIAFHKFAGCTIFITGATGLLGSLLVKSILYVNTIMHTDISVVAFVRNIEKAKQLFQKFLTNDKLVFCEGNITNTIPYNEKVDYIIHGASATNSKYFVSNPVETILTAVGGTENILEFAKRKQIKGMVYLSSLEIYGIPDKQSGLISETEYGYIDPLSIRSSYSEGKRMSECLCASYASEYHIPVKIARLSQTFGAGVAYNDERVFAEFARCVLENCNITLHTEGKTVRSYCYTADAVRAIVLILLEGETGQAYNITNMDTLISISDMAYMVCNLFPESKITVEYDIPKDISSFGYNPDMIIQLDSKKIMELGWQPQFNLEEMFKRLIISMRRE